MSEQPSNLANMLRAAVGALPVISRSAELTTRTVELDDITIDRENVAEYASVTGLRYRDTVPLTYPFVLTFPAMMSLATGFDFPFAAMGSVHTENVITRYRPISVTDTLGVTARAENLREHRKGLLVDLISEVKVGNELAWRQVTTFLHQQRTSLSGEPKPAPAKQPKLPPPNAILRITGGDIRRYASISGDHNPIHTSGLGAKLFGFPSAIAHGMFSAAAVLANIEAQIPDAVQYSVRFGKPILLPASVGVYTETSSDAGDAPGWDVALRNLKKGYPHLTGTVRGL
ncbi:MaoC/PaaZ C-terminal domain-containing protein [Mycolicibacterium brumae]|nr:MaoC/PaaZ C-terminal domain-containing protein [Mycolicibacterium brumae]RWA21636.1 dehydratase [Mycolicibacterium brumae DSM 44177]